MRVAIIGRTVGLLRCARMLVQAGHQIALVITSKEAPEYTVTADDFRVFAADVGATFIRTAQITRALEEIRVESCDIAVSVNYAGIIPQDVIDCFPLGILNAHGGDLPRYRGNACQAWAILNGEPHVGLCIHRMFGGELDSGDIVAEGRLPIDLRTKIGDVMDWIEDRIPELMIEAVAALCADPTHVIRIQSTDPAAALRCYPRLPEDALINWSKSAVEIVRLIKASGRPYGGAFTYLDGARVTIWDAAVVEDDERFVAVSGQITRFSPAEVATGQGKIILLDFEGADFRSIRQRLR